MVPSKKSSTTDVTPASDAAPASSGVAEFLYQLSKMLTDDNREVIEWSNSRIEVHNPHRLANEVLHKYFRHSKFASFQRQLNYFGFRKLAGKGKMAPCSYVNDAASPELRSLLLIKVRTVFACKYVVLVCRENYYLTFISSARQLLQQHERKDQKNENALNRRVTVLSLLHLK